MKESAFAKWFEEQHGPRPSPYDKDWSMHDAIVKGHKAQAVLNSVNEWEARRESAMYAWKAKLIDERKAVKR